MPPWAVSLPIASWYNCLPAAELLGAVFYSLAGPCVKCSATHVIFIFPGSPPDPTTDITIVFSIAQYASLPAWVNHVDLGEQRRIS